MKRNDTIEVSDSIQCVYEQIPEIYNFLKNNYSDKDIMDYDYIYDRYKLKNGEDPRSIYRYKDMSDIDLSNVDLHNIHIHSCRLKGANLSDTNLTHSKLSHVNLANTNFTNSNMSEMWLDDIISNNSKMNNVNLSNSYTYGSKFTCVDLSNSDLSNSRMFINEFLGCNLSNVDLSNADIAAVSFDKVNLTNANLSNASLRRLSLTKDVVLNNTIINNHTISSFDELDKLIPIGCPEKGSFIGYDHSYINNSIIVFEVPEDALRTTGFSKICKVNKAKVIEIRKANCTKSDETIGEFYYNGYDHTVHLGEVIESHYDPFRWDLYNDGIKIYTSVKDLRQFF